MKRMIMQIMALFQRPFSVSPAEEEWRQSSQELKEDMHQMRVSTRALKLLTDDQEQLSKRMLDAIRQTECTE